jgi:hypothetical protein
MRTRYVAHGLQLDCAFALPGMTACSVTRLPRLTIELADPDRMNRCWNARLAAPVWQGRLGDGCHLSIEQAVTGERLFTYGARARFHLSATADRLRCAPRLADPAWLRCMIAKVIPSVGVIRGYEALHASAVDSPEGVVAIAGPNGSGKSTLASELMRRGWRLFADDELTLGRANEGIRAHPGSPHMSLGSDCAAPQELGAVLATLANERWLAVARQSTQTRPVRTICLLERADGLPLQAEVLDANPLALAPHMLGLSSSAERRLSRFELYGDLVEHTPLLRLTGSASSTPAQLADLLEETVRRPQGMCLVESL